MLKCLKFGSYSKAYKATEMKEILKCHNNYKLLKSKFLDKHKIMMNVTYKKLMLIINVK